MEIKDIRRKLDILHVPASRDASAHGGIRKILPLAYPVLLSTWRIRQLKSEPVGVVERYILRALQELGSCSLEELDDLTCLGRDRLLLALQTMVAMGGPIVCEGKNYSLKGPCDMAVFTQECTHEFKFIINPQTGKLLPITMSRTLEEMSLDDETEPGFRICHRVRPLVLCGQESELPWLKEGANLTASRQGVPDGFVSVVAKDPVREKRCTVLAFLFYYGDHHWKVLTGRGDCDYYELLADDYGIKSLPQLEKVVEASPVLPEESGNVSFKLCDEGASTLQIFITGDSPWKHVDNVERETQVVLNDFLHKGWMWSAERQDNSYFQLVPGDNMTAHHLFLARAAYRLEDEYSQLSSQEVTRKWYADSYDVFRESYPLISTCPPFAELMDYILQTSDNGGLLEFLHDTYPEQVPVRAAIMKPRIMFLTSHDSRWPSVVLDAFAEVKHRLEIITPVIDDDDIFARLEQIKARYREARIITPLKEGTHQEKFKTDPLFLDYKLPRQKLAKCGAFVRAMSHVCHAKVVLVDGHKLLFMSANLNANSLGHGPKNAIEFCLIFDHHGLVKRVKDVFSELWQCACYQQIKQGSHTEISELPMKRPWPAVSSYKEGGFEFILSTPENLALSGCIVQLLSHARREVILMAMSCYDLEEVPPLSDAIFGALQRGISVTAVLRPGAEQFRADQWPDPSTKRLMAAGMKIVEVPHLHAKCVIADQKNVLVTSANLNPFSLGDKKTSHIEMGIVLPVEHPVSRQVVALALKLMRR